MNWITGSILTALTAGLIALLLQLTQADLPSSDADTISLSQGIVCRPDTAQPCAPVTLPYFVIDNENSKKATLTFSFDRTDLPSDLTAVYLPRLSDNMSLTINGTSFTSRIHDTAPYYRSLWNRPFYAIIPDSVLQDYNNTLNIELSATQERNLALVAIHIGEADALLLRSELMHLYRVGFSRFALGLTIATAISLAIFWLFRQRKPQFLLMAAAAACATVYSLQWTRLDQIFDLPDTTTARDLAVLGQIYFILRYADMSLSMRLPVLLRAIEATAVATVFFALTSQDWNVTLLVYAVTLLISIIALGKLVTIGGLWTRAFWLVSVVLLAVLTISGYARLIDPTMALYGFAQISPMLMTFTIIGVLLAELAYAQRRSDAMTRALSVQVAEKTAELAKSYRQMERFTRDRAVADERQRIMLDLHDGVGGQLVNALAYMESTQTTDLTLRDALEEALRDLSLMIDSMTPSGDVSVLLGMLRGRLEPLLAQHGLVFNWQIEDDPVMPDPGPSQNLRLMRIAQEAITNVVKHANATSITVATDRTSLMISDDGVGFDVHAALARAGQAGGFGLPGMQRRAKSIGAQLDIRSCGNGTELILTWPTAHPAP
ncbi:Signal transduction histidine kinase [Monaibacterium marinum]|uniref:Signal transduction histidine kinase n=1 Tax=Pontivivens marinum TaxID=1690039 RepID=A0A2C9CRJ2_9RHOB|nr:ATP-binding protein [Monaibacterium marinum]SOH93974.1 Signal transduction histidine kinase [Monaibacterium marinum]